MIRNVDGFGLMAVLFGLLALVLPLAGGEPALAWPDRLNGLAGVIGVIVVGALYALRKRRHMAFTLALIVAIAAGVVIALKLLQPGPEGGLAGRTSWGYWAYILALWALAWRAIDEVAAFKSVIKEREQIASLFVPTAFGLWLVFVWEAACVGFGVPGVLLPPPSAILVRLISSVAILWADFFQTFVKAVLTGYIMGCASGFVVAVLVDRVPFLRRGLLPLGNMVSALPIVGVAPIMVMWFGFDWQSKAAVVVISTFFPMLVNTLSGFAAAGPLERELMRSYGASYWQSLFKLRLPAAMPFIFNALKINSTLALIGAIVAEFFGTPIVGMGFRISTEVGRMNVDMVWAEIVIAALAGSAFYGVMATLERAVTFWHPSYRSKK